jgi:rhodanese-related sulfurtransferase
VRRAAIFILSGFTALATLAPVALFAISCGYGGPSLDVAALKAKLDADPGALLVVDVRPLSLFEKGHVKGARNIPLEEIDAHMDELVASSRPLAVICTCGKRSLEAIEKLRARGVEPFLVVGGMLEWEKAGFPVTR